MTPDRDATRARLPDAETEQRRALAAERQRRFRERQKRRRGVVPVEVDPAALAETLILAGYLPERDASDFAKVCAAASRMLQHYCEL